MRHLLAILILLFIMMDKAWAVPEIKLVQGTATLPDEGRGLFKITGEAEMIWDQLLSPDAFSAAAAEVRLVPFPDVWSALEHDGLSRQGKASYRITIQLPESRLGQPLGMWLPRSLGSATIWLNGKKIIEHDFGPDGTDLFDSSPGHNRVFIVPRERTLQFVIQTFNWHMHTGGFLDRFLIGPAEDLQKINFDLMAFDFLVFGLLVFSSIYHLWLFTFRRKFVAYRDLGLFFLLVVARMLSTGSSHWLSELGCNEMIVFKLGWITYYGGIMVGVHLIRSIYPDETPGLLIKIVRVVAIVACTIVLVTPLSFSHILLRPMQIFTIAVAGPLMWTLFRAYLNRRQGTLVLLPATALVLGVAVLEIYNSLNKIDQNYSLLGIGMLLFSLGASVSQSVSFDRTFHRVERQTRGINGLNQKLRKQAEILERRIHQTTEEMSTLLHNLPEGVLLIEGQNGQLGVGSYLSQSMKRILGSDTVTWPLVQKFFLETHLDSDQRAQLEATLSAMIGDDAISFEMNAENLPKELLVSSDRGTQSYLCAWAPVVLDGIIHSVLLVLVDVSSERSVYHQFEMEQQIFDRMLQLLTTESDNLPVFMQEAQQIMRRLESSSQAPEAERSPALLRELHTLKGLARGFGLLGLAKTAHEMEERLLRQPLSRLDTLFAIWASHQKAFSMLGFSSHDLPAREKEEDLLLVCGQLLAARFDPPSEAWQSAWQDYVKSIFVRFDELVASVGDGLGSVAEQLGKPMPRLVIEGGDVGIRRSVQGKLLGGLTHILRNALDHGLENPEERRAQNKPEQGAIFITLHFREKILIEVHDDGRGLNLHGIRLRALEKGLMRADQDLSDEQLAQFVFAPGFSTKTAVNDISGRGIGMDAVQAAIRQMGGQIRIVWRSRKNEQGFRQGMWCISLPRRFGFHEVSS
jgi:HPt (histidine-containing phosphotransfer) domain-containing protein